MRENGEAFDVHIFEQKKEGKLRAHLVLALDWKSTPAWLMIEPWQPGSISSAGCTTWLRRQTGQLLDSAPDQVICARCPAYV